MEHKIFASKFIANVNNFLIFLIISNGCSLIKDKILKN